MKHFPGFDRRLPSIFSAWPAAAAVLFAFMLVVVTGSFSPIPASSDGSAINARLVPFKARLKTSIQILGPGPIAPVRSFGSGVASHMGRTDFESRARVNFLFQPAQISGTAVLTAANGDQLFTSFSGTSFVNAQGLSIGSFVHEITGGTGRFSEATGTLVGEAVHNLAAPSGTLTLAGDIHY